MYIAVAAEPVDPYLAYRLLNPGFRYWSDLSICQRNLSSFKEEVIFTNNATGHGTCMNCHSFCNKNPDQMMLHLRGQRDGTLIMHNGVMQKVNTKTAYTMSAGVYPSWHPNGNLIAFSVNIIRQHFFSQPQKSIGVFDYHSDLILYNIEKNMVTTSPKISTNDMENLPEWSPDGKYLYYCSGEKSDAINKQKYQLMRIAYDCTANTWGKIDTVLGHEQVQESISFPKISPDGKYLLFCLSPQGYFTIHNKESDLYLLNLESGGYRKLDVNSDYTESYHSWSSNGRWFVFSSKRDDGFSARPYICYFDTTGKEHKPFLLPQKDPSFYDLLYKSYNVPEFITGPVRVPYHALKKTVYSNAKDAVFDRDVDIDALSGATRY
jgi:Tol biopolymer transport system component